MGASREGRDIIIELLYLLYSLAPRTDRPRCRGDVHGDHPLFRFSTVRFAPVMMQEGTARTPRHSISPPRGLYVEPPGTAVLPAFRFVIMFTALYVISPMSMRARASGNRARSVASQSGPPLDLGAGHGAGRLRGLHGVRDVGVQGAMSAMDEAGAPAERNSDTADSPYSEPGPV